MKKNVSKIGAVAVTFFTPVIAFAEGKDLKYLISVVTYYMNLFAGLIIGLAVLTFIWNIYNYFFKADVENKKEAGLYVLYSTVGFFVILSLWGLVNILTNTFNLGAPQPTFPFGATSNTSAPIQLQGTRTP